jgi:hypothetical protein
MKELILLFSKALTRTYSELTLSSTVSSTNTHTHTHTHTHTVTYTGDASGAVAEARMTVMEMPKHAA